MLLGELTAWSANQYLGCLLTFVAAAFYSYLKASGSKPPPPPPPQPESQATKPLVGPAAA